MDTSETPASARRLPSAAEGRSQLAGILLVNLATVTWAANITLGRWLRQDIGPITLSAARFTIASFGYAVLLRRLPRHEHSLGVHRWKLLAMGICGVTLFAPTLYFGLRFTTSVNATLINGCAPLITALLAALLIGERLSRRQFAGSVTAVVGVFTLVFGSSRGLLSSASFNQGDLVIFGACILWALYSVIGREVMHARSALSTSALSAFLGLPVLLVAALLELQTQPFNVGPAMVVAIGFIGVFPSLIGFLAWNEGVRRLGPSGAMIFYNTLPLYGTLLGVLLLGERVGIWHLVGGALIVGGGLWSASRHAREDSSPQSARSSIDIRA